MNQKSFIVFVCEHGAAKSIIAAAYFNRFASQRGLHVRAVARGTDPEDKLSPQAVKGLAGDGLTPAESAPQELVAADLQLAQSIIAFCKLPNPYHNQVPVERWEDVPAVSESYEQARDAIVRHIRKMLER